MLSSRYDSNQSFLPFKNEPSEVCQKVFRQLDRLSEDKHCYRRSDELLRTEVRPWSKGPAGSISEEVLSAGPRALTHEGKLQVELAQLKHLSTRLIRGWTHLKRQKGGIGVRGPGETQLESDRRLVQARILTLEK